MKLLMIFSISILLISCNLRQTNSAGSTKIINKDSLTNEKNEKIQYSAKQLEWFLDSVGKLDSKMLIDKSSFITDSIFKNQQSLNDSLNPKDFDILKNACKSETIDLKFAKKILRDVIVDSSYLKLDKIPLTYISFDKDKYAFNEYAICAGNSDIDWQCELYFFKSNKIIARHKIDHRYGLDLKHYKDFDGKTILYYKENYQSGSGIWWFNYYFYKYDDNKIIPILNELDNSNLQYPWHIRVLWLESFILNTNPLTIKMVYYQYLPDSSDNLHRIINDSTLKRKLQDSLLVRQATLKYLNEVKNHYTNTKQE